MGYAKVALLSLRIGIGLYMILTAITRVFSLDMPMSYTTMFGMMGMAVPDVSYVKIGVSIFLGLLGLVLLWGRALVVAGVVVTIVGLWNGAATIIASQAPNVPGINRLGLLTLGMRDVLVLGSTGIAIACLDAYIRRHKAALHGPHVTMFHREKAAPVAPTDVPPTTRV
jgi:hypothetical protein